MSKFLINYITPLLVDHNSWKTEDTPKSIIKKKKKNCIGINMFDYNNV